MNLSYQKSKLDSGIILFELEGKILTTTDSEELAQEIATCIEKNEIRFIFKLKNLEYINSTGLNFIISSFTKARNAGGELVICEVSEKVQDLLVITKLNTILTSFKTLDEAIQNFEIKTINN
mgnify:CR=1 FL=1